MRWCNYLVVLAVLAAVAAPTSASGLFGSRKPPANPTERVRQLVAAVQTSRDDNERTEAVQQLREFDAVAHPTVVPALVSALRTDRTIGVRIEAARSLGRIRPLTTMARDALFEASLHDSAIRVRWQARTSLTYYTVANVNPYNHSSSQPPPAGTPTVGSTTKEPPVTSVPGSSGGIARPAFVPSTQPVFTPSPSTGFARPLPKGPPQPAPSGSASNNPAQTFPSTQEPPLAPNVPVPPLPKVVAPAPAISAQQAPPPLLNLNPATPNWAPAPVENLPLVPPVNGLPGLTPPPAPTQGPILAPPQ
jgi:hypothetical protein